MRYVNPIQVISAASMGADVTQTIATAGTPSSGALGPVHQYAGFAYHANWTGTPVGNLQIEISGDGGGHWDIVAGSIVPAGGASGQWVWTWDGMFSADMVRFHYVRTSSTGTLNVFFCARGMN